MVGRVSLLSAAEKVNATKSVILHYDREQFVERCPKL